MTRGRKMKQEHVERDVELPTPSISSQAAGQSSTPNELPLRAGSQPVCQPGAASAVATSVLQTDAMDDLAKDTEMHNAFAQEAMQALGDQSRQLINMIRKLEALNIESTLPSLPMFVVIGDQSAGKSSVIEAACEISLPRDEGTCTRCPFKITTTASRNGEPWQVSLHLEYAYTPGKRAGSGSTFDHWLNQDRIVRDFTTVYSKEDLNLALRRAQLAILNPHKDHLSFVNASLSNDHGDSQRVGFSPNVINLDITAPQLPELSFYDLPGAINTMAEESQQYLVKFVELLLKNYISKDKAYILLACAANSDLENSTALRYLGECNARKRSMGIYTKLDMVEMNPRRIEHFRSLLSDAQHKLGDGWFFTRQLSQTEIDQQQFTYAQGRDREAAFFAEEVWSELSDFSHRFGIPKLTARISHNLRRHILHELPEIVQRVQVRLGTVERQLAKFAEPAKDLSVTVMTQTGNVSNAIISEINADKQGTFRTAYRDIFRECLKNLQSLKPHVVLATPGYVKPSISLSSDEEESPTKSIRMNGGGRAYTMTPNQSAQKRNRRTPATQSSQSTNSTSSTPTRIVFHLDQTKTQFDSAPGADIPGQVSESVVRDLIKKAVSSWGTVPEQLLESIHTKFLKMLEQTADAALPQYQNTEFLRQVKQIASALQEQLHDEITTAVIYMVEAEKHRPMTYNGSLLGSIRISHEQNLRKRRNEIRIEEHYDDLEAEGRKVPSKPDQKKKAIDDAFIRNELGEDEYAREVKALATPMAYYDMASAQLVDGMAKHIELGLMHEFEIRLLRKLIEDMNITNSGRCAELLAEDPETERRRARLTAEKKRLEEALKELMSVDSDDI